MLKKILLFLVVFTLVLSALSFFSKLRISDSDKDPLNIQTEIITSISSESNIEPPLLETVSFDNKILACLGDSITYTTAHGYVSDYILQALPQGVQCVLLAFRRCF